MLLPASCLGFSYLSAVVGVGNSMDLTMCQPTVYDWPQFMLHCCVAANMQVVGFAGVQGVPLDRTVAQVSVPQASFTCCSVQTAQSKSMHNVRDFALVIVIFALMKSCVT